MLRQLLCVLAVCLSQPVLADVIDATWSAEGKNKLRQQIQSGQAGPVFTLPEIRIYDSSGALLLRASGADVTQEKISALLAAPREVAPDPQKLIEKLKDFSTTQGSALVLPHVKQQELVIVNFWADWCSACKILAPKLATLLARFEHIHLIRVESDYPAMMRQVP